MKVFFYPKRQDMKDLKVIPIVSELHITHQQLLLKQLFHLTKELGKGLFEGDCTICTRIETKFVSHRHYWSWSKRKLLQNLVKKEAKAAKK